MKVQLAIRWTLAAWADCYFWTFTFPEAQDWNGIQDAWRAIYKRLRNAPMRWPWCGVRVFETHPGGHGVHIHCCVPHFYDVKEIRRLLTEQQPALCGRMQVARVKAETRDKVADYMATYLCKWRWAGGRPPKGARLWATFGLMADQKTTVCEIETDGPAKRVYHWIEDRQRWHLLMQEFGIDPRRKGYHRLLCLKQLFATGNPYPILAGLMPDAPVDWFAEGGSDTTRGKTALLWEPRPLFSRAPGSLRPPVSLITQ